MIALTNHKRIRTLIHLTLICSLYPIIGTLYSQSICLAAFLGQSDHINDTARNSALIREFFLPYKPSQGLMSFGASLDDGIFHNMGFYPI